MSLRKKLSTPQEPIGIKEELKGMLGSSLGKASIKQSTWIATLLWRDAGWGKVLKDHAISWQKFMSILRDHYYYWLDWIENRKSWEEIIDELVRHLERECEK